MTDVRAQIAAALRREIRTDMGLKSGDYFPSEKFDHLADVLMAGPVGELVAENERLRSELSQSWSAGFTEGVTQR